VGDGVDVDGVDGDVVEPDGDAVAPAASDADGCGFTVWRPTRAATLDEPDVPQAIATKPIKTTDMTRATTRCVVRRRDTDTFSYLLGTAVLDGWHQGGTCSDHGLKRV
jgi:hypothetical protein